jgi:hypothetical protein
MDYDLETVKQELRAFDRVQYPNHVSYDTGCARELRNLLRFTLEGWISHARRTEQTANNPFADRHARSEAYCAAKIVEALREAAAVARISK